MSNLLFIAGLILIGFSAGLDYMLTHGVTESWEALQRRDWQITLSVICLVSGLSGLGFYVINHSIAKKLRFTRRKRYGDMYK
ncbi:hypothetical protein [Pantoea ananatis]|uniref:hypothetical protein n=1 Tax=Pantoea ananas TaxID=553 RepID=UPI001B30FC26|nr:hypothetical protein [Pantoea ananatis]